MFETLSADDQGRLVYLIALLALVGSGVVFGARANLGRNLRYLLIWFAIFAGIAVVASFRPELSQIGARVMGEVDPARGEAVGPSLRLAKRSDGHFWVRAKINGTSVLFIVDTGASGISLSPETARAIGFDPARLTYSLQSMTANGEARFAPVQLRTLEVGPILRGPMRAAVSQGGLDVNLLGMDFLNTLSGYRVEGDILVLTP